MIILNGGKENGFFYYFWKTVQLMKIIFEIISNKNQKGDLMKCILYIQDIFIYDLSQGQDNGKNDNDKNPAVSSLGRLQSYKQILGKF